MLYDKTLIDLFNDQVNKKPDEIAIILNHNTLTYKELDEASNLLARHLQSLNIIEHSLVPLLFNRSLEMVISIWAVMKIGAAYVPIDPEYPIERIRFMLDDIKANFILTRSDCNDVSSQLLNLKTIAVDLLSETLQTTSKERLSVIPKPEHLAYVIYTSGSTGKPKGVMVSHKAIVNRLLWGNKYFNPTESDAILQKTTYCFDVSIGELIWSTIAGIKLVLAVPGGHKDISYLKNIIREQHITIIHFVPSMLDLFLTELNEGDCPTLRCVLSSGEALKPSHVNLFQKKLPHVTLHNLYGPTEAAIEVSYWSLFPEDKREITVVPIGKAVDHTDLLILNNNNEQVSDNEIGELHIGGIQLADGYLNRPDLTEEKFIPNPVANPNSPKLYKTGDLARWLPDGNIEYMGRSDDQVKIRGFRIELGEIESNILDVAGVKRCVVIPQGEENPYLVAYIVTEGIFDRDHIKKHLLSRLPDYMIPQFIIQLDDIPLMANGKVDKKSLPLQDPSEFIDTLYKAPQEPTEKLLANLWKGLLYVNRVGVFDNFFELGGNSILAQKMVATLRNEQLNLPITTLYKQPYISAIAAFLDGRETVKALKVKKKREPNMASEIAIIGMAGRFPGANNIEELWSLLKTGKESIHFFKDDEIDESILPAVKNQAEYVKARGVITDAEYFDPAFFGISPNMAELMDPQQRVFLEISWEALERSGYAVGNNDTTIGVFAGCGNNTYFTHNVINNKDKIDRVGSFQAVTVNDKDYVSSRVAYALDLKGPAITVQSACSTSLLAIAQAVESIKKGQCDVALAGGVAINSPINTGHLYEEGAMLSIDGHTRPFDSEAKGTVFSDGAGVVVLKNKAEAIKDGDIIYAVIRGTGVSNDGGGKGSFTAPSPEGQAAAIRMAIEDAGINASDISYVETHGTATPLGDPIEIEGLNLAFGKQEKKQYCRIGSIKSNMGHLTIAAGVAGLIKTALSLHYKQLPPSINYEQANPNIDFDNSPFRVNTSLENWETDKIRRAGVSSFGVGGTNVHVILEESNYKPPLPSTQIRPVQLICWSAKSAVSLAAYRNKLSDFIDGNKELNLEDLAYTLHTSRKNFNFRNFILTDNSSSQILDNEIKNSVLKEVPDKLVFMFPGQGAQHLNMAKDLYLHEVIFREAMDECAKLLLAELNENILSIIFPEVDSTEAKEKIRNTKYSQPAIFCIEYALGKLWMSWGIFPDAFVGHSIGEFVAAYFSGILSLKDALKLIANRGRMMSDLPFGSMLSVRTSVDKIQDYLSEEIALAAVNSPNLCVLSGSIEAIAALCIILDKKDIPNSLLSTSHAFHSHMMDAVLDPFEKIVNKIQLNKPSVPILSTVTGDWLKDEEATSPTYWANHLRATVVFGDSIKKLISENYQVFIEVGPGSTTATLTRQQATGKSLVIVSSLEKELVQGSSYRPLLKALGQLWLSGIQPDWNAFYNYSSRPIPEGLPTYSFDRKRFWVNPLYAIEPVSQPANNKIEQISTSIKPAITKPMRKVELLNKIKDILENVSGVEMQDVTADMTFVEIGLDSLLLTQIAITLKKEFKIPITFRQLNEQYDTLESLASYLDTQLPDEIFENKPQEIQQSVAPQMNGNSILSKDSALDLINQQLQLLAKQVALLQGDNSNSTYPVTLPLSPSPALSLDKSSKDISAEEAIEIKKPFGATAKIERSAAALSEKQQYFLDQLVARYNKKTLKSKTYTEENRLHTADPRVVSGFRPATKELVYPIVVNKSKGSKLWDLDGNEYIDALNGFGSNMFGNQPDFIKDAMLAQIEKGYEIGPQHELTGSVSKLIAEFTGFERVGLCNTGSEAVLGAMRIARTVTGRSIIVAFTGSYHGIVDEVIVRGTKKLKSFPAASGILPESVQNMLILDYGTEEALRIIKDRAHEIAAVLVEPIQSRRPEFQPIAFLKELRTITAASGTALIFDEVISGFRFHPGGAQAMFDVKADIATYGKVIGGGLSIGAIAGDHHFLDALDGGSWHYGDDSAPEVGVTYFAGTFVRHPLALACAKASLEYMKEKGPDLQVNLNHQTLALANRLNEICLVHNVPMYVVQFGSLWKVKYHEEFRYSELFFTLMREKGIHIMDGFPCFLTTAHSPEDISKIIEVFEQSLIEFKDSGFILGTSTIIENEIPEFNVFDKPPVPNAKLGKDANGNPAWFISDDKHPGKFLQINII